MEPVPQVAPMDASNAPQWALAEPTTGAEAALVALMPPLKWLYAGLDCWQAALNIEAGDRLHEEGDPMYYMVRKRSAGRFEARLHRYIEETDDDWTGNNRTESDCCYLTQAEAERSCQIHKARGEWQINV